MNLQRSQITPMTTTSYSLGSFQGPQQPNLQIDHLEPGEYTLQFQVVEPPADVFPFATYAIVHWKVNGQQLQRIISVFSGAVLGGVAEAVDVQLLDQSNRSIVGHFAPILAALTPGSTLVTLAGMGGTVSIPATSTLYFNVQPSVGYTPVAPVVNGVPGTTFLLTSPYTGLASPGSPFWLQAPYKIGVSLSKGTRPPIQQPPVLLTTESPITVPHNTVRPVGGILIPQDAGVLSILTSVVPELVPNISLTNAGEGSVLFTESDLIPRHGYIPGTPQSFYPLPPGTSRVLFSNSSGQSLNFTYQWGIEG